MPTGANITNVGPDNRDALLVDGVTPQRRPRGAIEPQHGSEMCRRQVMNVITWELVKPNCSELSSAICRPLISELNQVQNDQLHMIQNVTCQYVCVPQSI